MDKYIKKIDKQ